MFTLGRKIDIHYPTNKIIVALSLLTAAMGGIITGEILSGAYIGGGTFLTWALAREIDPKHEYSAFLCVALSLLNLFYYENIQLLVIFWILLVLRIVNGITGKELGFLDIFSLLAMTVYLTINNQKSIYLIPFIMAMAFVIRFKERRRLAFIAAALGLTLFVIESFFMEYLLLSSITRSVSISAFVTAIVFISFLFWIFISKDDIRDDLGNLINRSNILASQILYSLILLLSYFFGNISVNNLIIYLSVIIGVIIYWLASRFFPKSKSRA